MEQTSERFEQVTFPELTCGVQDFPAKTSAYPETNWDLKESVQACFSQLQSLLETQKKKIDPTCYSLKTLKIYYQLIEEPTSSPFSLNWPKSGTMQNGMLKTLKTGCHKTESGFSLSPQSVFDFIDRPEPNKTVMDIVEENVEEKYYLKPEQTEKLLEKLDDKSMAILLEETQKQEDGLLPCITPGRINKRQNGKRLKHSDNPMFTLTAQDKHGLVVIKQLIGGKQGERVYDPNGLSVTLNANGGGQGAKTGLGAFVDLSKEFPAISDKARCLQARYQKGMTNRKAEISGILQIGRGNNPGGIKTIVPSLTSSSWQHNNFAVEQIGYKVKSATKKGYEIAVIGDCVNLDFPDSKTRRGRVGKEIAQTLNTSCNQGYIEPDLKIRRLTPRECFRLQGMPEESIDKAFETIAKDKPISDSQLYKIAGNGVTVPVVSAIAEAIKRVVA